VQVGDLVKYNNSFNGARACPAVILYINEDGGTVKALLPSGEIGWMVKSGCNVISEKK